MSLWPMDSAAYWNLAALFGPDHGGGPVPTDTVLVGGQRQGERMRTPCDSHLRVPRRVKVSYVAPEPPTAPSTYAIDEYEKRTLVPCFDAAPVKVWVLRGLSDDAALALYQEWR
jgi:hypothetical protein